MSSFFLFGEDWRGRPEREEEEEDIATGGEGFFGAGGQNKARGWSGEPFGKDK